MCQWEAWQAYVASYCEYRNTSHLFVIAAVNRLDPLNIYAYGFVMLSFNGSWVFHEKEFQQPIY